MRDDKSLDRPPQDDDEPERAPETSDNTTSDAANGLLYQKTLDDMPDTPTIPLPRS